MRYRIAHAKAKGSLTLWTPILFLARGTAQEKDIGGFGGTRPNAIRFLFVIKAPMVAKQCGRGFHAASATSRAGSSPGSPGGTASHIKAGRET